MVQVARPNHNGATQQLGDGQNMLELSLTVVCIFFVGLITSTGASKQEWSYKGQHTGTHQWDRLFPTGCAGRKQSPIDIITKETTYNATLNDFVLFHDPPLPGSVFRVKNNGHAVQVDTAGPFFVSNGGLPAVYSTAQFHFHWGHANHHGSEHYIDGRASPIELHVVSYDKDHYASIADAMVKTGGLAVLGVMFEITDTDNPVLEPIVEALEMVQDPDINEEVEIPATRIRDFLPEDTSKYYRYDGSLTTPKCFESVIWTVFENKQRISYRQLTKFRKVLERSRRRHGSRRNRRHMKHGSAAALDEVGIKGNIAEELALDAALERELTESHNHDHHNPAGHANIGETPTKFQLNDEEVPSKQAQMEATPEPEPTKGDHEDDDNHDNHGGHENHGGHHKSHEDHHEEPTPEPKPIHYDDHSSHHGNNAGAEVEIEEVEIIQEYLVNNFRPVQPLGKRKVYRSFEFRDVRVRAQSGSTGSQTYNSYEVRNAGNHLYFSYIAIFMSAIFYVFL
ncbi:uncharacterized protein [Argopecten irradians]|uniref:uncharacterized protein n=1 Tax=Argopecten irradians TaxID=31199 RepID=UPI00371DBEF7